MRNSKEEKMLNKPINIMQVVLSLACGGLERLTLQLSDRLNKEKYRVTICCLDREGELAAEGRLKGINIVAFDRKPGFDMLLPFKLAVLMRKQNIDIVHTHNPCAMIYGTLGARLARVPVVMNTRHNGDIRHVNRIIWAMNDIIAVISRDAQQTLLRHNKIKQDKTLVVYNGIDENKFNILQLNNQFRINLGINSRAHVIGTASRLSTLKDQYTMIESFCLVLKQLPNSYLVLVGDGPERQTLEQHSARLNVSKNVIFLGFRNDIVSYLSMFDLFIMSSLMEGIPLALLEAMAVSRPVVVTNVGGNSEVVIEGETGILIPPKDSEKMAQAIIKILQNPNLAKKMGEAGRKRVEDKFTLDRMVNRYESIYEEYLARKGRGSRE